MNIESGTSAHVSLGALDALSTSLAVTANNVANVSTDGFRSSDVRLETGPGGQGVRVGEIRESEDPGPLRQDLIRSVGEDGGVTVRPGMVEGSNTDVAREMTDMMTTQRAFEANANAIRAREEMTGVLVNDFV